MKTRLEMGIKTPVMGIESVSYSSHKNLFENVIYVDAAMGSIDLQKRKFALSGSDNMLFVPYIYDAIQLIGETFNEFYSQYGRLPTGLESGKILRRRGYYEGEAGKAMIHPNGVLESEAVFKKISNGKVVIAE